MSVKKILNEHKDLFLWLVMICWISLVSIFWNTEWFRASILQIPEKFDWAVYPIEKVPNWFTWWWNNKTTKFSEISQENLVNISKYSLAVWWKPPDEIKWETKEKQAKLTYSVVYLWNYDIQNREEWKGSHPAVDIRVPVWTPIRAISNWKIIKIINSNSWFWKHIVLELRNVPEYWNPNKKTNYYVSYSHLSQIDVKVWQIVKKWQIIWKTWNSWTSTTPHLHFQIDKKDAPRHPYWPFTAKEVYWANLNFFTAVKEWLWKENAIKYTINPLKWIDENFNNKNISVKTENIVKKDEVKKSEIKFSILWKEEFEVWKELKLKIIAKDEKNKTIKNFKPTSEIKISSTSNTAKFSKILKFKNWIAEISIKNPQAEEFTFEITNWKEKFSKKIISKEAEKVVIKKEENIASLESDSENLHWTSEKTETWKTTENTEKTSSTWTIKIKKEETEKVIKQEVKKEIPQTEKLEENLHESAKIEEKIEEKPIFTDVLPENKNYEAIKYLKENWVIWWYSDWSFKPEKTVSRVEAIKMIFAWLKISTENKKDVNFKDTVNDAWYSPFVWAAMQKWIVKWYSDWTFKPSKSVNRSEYYKILLLSAEINPPMPSENPFADVPKDSWFWPYVWFVKDTNLIKVDWENFKPWKWVSRAEVAESLYNLIKFLGK